MSRNIFNKDLVNERYASFDVTNQQEMLAIIILFFFDYYLMISLLLNIRKILLNYYQDAMFNPQKLLCINSILIFSVIIRIISNLYSLIGCGMSHFYNFDSYVSIQSTIYFNPFAYESLQIIFINFENVAMLVSAYFWIQTINTKSNVDQDEDEIPSLMVEQPFYLVALEKILKYAWMILIIQLFTSLIVCNSLFDDSYSSYFILTCSVSSSTLFSVSCYIFIRNLEQLFKVDKKFNRKVKHIGISLIGTQMFRVITNFFYLSYSSGMQTFKTGGFQEKTDQDVKFPDENYFWSLFLLIFTIIVDFYPTYQIGFLFSPIEKQNDLSCNIKTQTILFYQWSVITTLFLKVQEKREIELSLIYVCVTNLNQIILN